MVSRRLAVFGLSCLALLSAGCASFTRPAFNGEDGVNGVPVLIVPFRESGRRLWYGESTRGKRLAALIKNWAREEARAADFVEGRDAEQVLEAVTEWRKEKITSREWQSLTRGLGVQYVVEGNIKDFSLRQPDVYGIYDARAVVDYRVINAATGKVAYESVPPKQVRYGGGREIPVRDAFGDDDDRVVEARLLQRLAEEIGKDLYGSYGD